MFFNCSEVSEVMSYDDFQKDRRKQRYERKVAYKNKRKKSNFKVSNKSFKEEDFRYNQNDISDEEIDFFRK